MFIVAFIREFIGTGAISMNDLSGNLLFSLQILPKEYAIPLFVQPTGAFLVLGVCVAAFIAIKENVEAKKAAKAKALAEAAKNA